MPVVLSAEAGGTMVHEAVGHGLEGDLVYENMSVYAGPHRRKGGQRTGHGDRRRHGARPPGLGRFDDEGTPCRKNVVIDKGVLKGYLQDRLSAWKLEAQPTGNGRRESYRHRPYPRMTNTMIAPGNDDPESIVRSTGEGLLVRKMGGGQVNTINGDFVFEVSEGYLIKDGKVGPPGARGHPHRQRPRGAQPDRQGGQRPGLEPGHLRQGRPGLAGGRRPAHPAHPPPGGGRPAKGLTLLPPSPARLLWDTGGLWSLMTLEAAWQRGLTLEPISAAQIADGGLEDSRLLVAPGGWSARKKKALGSVGAEAIAAFVRQGGIYLGFCGGAGLALAVDDGLGLVNLDRASGEQRLPGLSGPVKISPCPEAQSHPLWQHGEPLASWPVWWPGQFNEPHDPAITVLARYHGPTEDMRLSGPTDDPATLWGQPAVIEARLGRGRLLLSYPHLDTPGEEPAGQALERLWSAWLGDQAQSRAKTPPSTPSPAVSRLAARCAALWEQGRDLGLWQERHPIMPLWQRGARGLEFWELARLSGALALWAEDDSSDGELAKALEPILTHGEAVLRAQAALIAGLEPEAEAAEIHAAWFPRPRRTGGDWASVRDLMEKWLLELL